MKARAPAARETDARRPRIEDGVLLIDDEPRLLVAGEYPYYRDDPARWEPKLRALRRAGLEVVTFYIPWRHHEIDDDHGGRSLRFDGKGDRDLVGFIDLVGRCGLRALPKPGPYVHAELPFGGMPDRVSPTCDPRREAATSAAGEPLRAEGLVLPAADGPGFRANARRWLMAVGDVLRGVQHPDGPIVAVQVGNEGAYGEAALEVDAEDYSPSAAAAFQAFAPGCGPPRAWVAPRTLADLRPYLLWGEWLGDAIASRLAWFAASLDLEVPMLANLPPPARAERHHSRPGGRYDAWLLRNRPWRRPGVHYATTSWVGNATLDDEALVSNVLAAGVRRGPNLEENWSLRWADPLAEHANVPIFHALLRLACGATGATVYTACATDSWGSHLGLDRLAPPYGDAAPVTVDGRAGPSFEPLRVLCHFLNGVGPEIARARPQPGITWCSYSPYAALGAWDPRPAAVAGHELPAPSTTLAWMLEHCLQRAVPVALADVEAELPTGPLALRGGPFMAREAQARVAQRVADERAPLLLLGAVPRLDERFELCTTLAGALARPTDGRVSLAEPRDRQELPAVVDAWLARLPGVAARPPTRSHVELRRVDPQADSTFVFLLSRSSETMRIRTEAGGLELAVRLPPYASSVVQVRDGLLTSCYVKGISEQAATGVPVEVRAGRQEIAATRACDLSARRRDGAWDVVASGGAANAVAIRGTPG